MRSFRTEEKIVQVMKLMVPKTAMIATMSDCMGLPLSEEFLFAPSNTEMEGIWLTGNFGRVAGMA
jgi:hypothetical protein